jgi:plastocyanin
MKALITIIILALIGWGVYALVNDNEIEIKNPTQQNTQTNNESPVTTTPQNTVKEFTVTGKNFSFSPSTMTVNKGDRVRIIFQNTGGTHDWVIDEFSARTKVLTNGQTETIEFVADKTGTFEYYCSVGTHRQMGMKGTLTVQ